MTTKTRSTTWKFFVSAAVFSGGLSLKLGAPASAVLFGVALAAMAAWVRPRLVRRVAGPPVGD